jgi:hypothetical protein
MWQVKMIPLKRLLEKTEIETLLKAFSSAAANVAGAAADAADAAVGIADAQGQWLVAPAAALPAGALVQQVCQAQQPARDGDGHARPVQVDGALYGVVYGAGAARTWTPLLAQALELLIRRAMIQKSLARETLDRYREINLLYRAHETIGASVDLDEVIRRVLQEAIHIIQADGGSVLLPNGLAGQLIAHDSVSLDVAEAERRLLGRAFVDKVFQTGRPRIVNDLQRLIRPASAEDVQLVALLGAPLKSVDHVLGVIALARTRPGHMFTAGDEKLLTALASQAGIAVANAREVAARERRLRQQIDALRIEIDEAKKQREVFAITESDFFEELQRNAQRMRAEFDI